MRIALATVLGEKNIFCRASFVLLKTGIDMSSLNLKSDLGIEAANELHVLLLPAIHEKKSVVVDCSAAERIHAACLQVLCAFVRDRQEAKRKTQLINPSLALREAATAIGVCSLLGIESMELKA
jgi:anti-anti-sigma regulatory factor